LGRNTFKHSPRQSTRSRKSFPINQVHGDDNGTGAAKWCAVNQSDAQARGPVKIVATIQLGKTAPYMRVYPSEFVRIRTRGDTRKLLSGDPSRSALQLPDSAEWQRVPRINLKTAYVKIIA
jgi:hypothetical protein